MSEAAADPFVSELVPGRTCEQCTLCCKLLEVESIDKPRAAWCPHCDRKRGCHIYDDRPGECGAFYCGYRRIAYLDQRWLPSKAKFIVNYEEDTQRIVIHVDQSRPDAWRAEPFYRTIKSWAKSAAQMKRMLIVWTGPQATLVFPDREKDLGVVRDDQFFVAVERMTPRGPELDFDLVSGDDPRVAGSV